MKVKVPPRLSGRQNAPFEESSYGDVKRLPPGALLVRVLGVDYVHSRTADGGDLYLTEYGVPFLEQLKPERWYDSEWFTQHRVKLSGTSTVYRVPTREVDGKSIDLVVKYCRVGQDVPLETGIIYKVLNADFNSPFEEFALLEELRKGAYGPQELTMQLQVPLSIYVPPERMQLWQTGRSEAKIASKIAGHPGIEIDILRDYILMYAWIHGWDAVEAHEKGFLSEDKLIALTKRVTDELHTKGFRVLDMKPKHIIVKPDDDDTLLWEDDPGKIQYGLVDFELLQRTPEYDDRVKGARRAEYLVRQRDRFTPKPMPCPKHLKYVSILGHDYVYGHAESTGGRLWVVGRDPGLFDYFLPERWRKTRHFKLSQDSDVFYTRTKDNIHLVWKVSRVGERPAYRVGAEQRRRLLANGFNSPFEEFAFALRLRESGVPTIYPRAIYMTGHTLTPASPIADDSRFQSHVGIVTPNGDAVLQASHDYITIWGYWNGPDEMLANHDGEYYKSVNADQACHNGWMQKDALQQLLERERRRLASAGMEALHLKADHLLLSLDPKGLLRMDEDNLPEARLCNFQLLAYTHEGS